MTELDTPEQKKQKLDEMTSMNISMSGETADDVASLMKLLGNAGMSEPEAPGAETMPMRQDMERLAGIMGVGDEGMAESCLCCGQVHEGACTDHGPHECSCCGEMHSTGHQEGLDERSGADASEREQLMDLVKRASKGDRRAKSTFEDYVGKTFNVDAQRLLMKLSRLDDRDRARAIEELINSERSGQDEYKSAAQGVRRTQMQFNGEDYEQEGYDNEPDADYQDTEYMTKDISGGLNRQKKQYAKAQDGDNAMAVESVKEQLYKKLAEKKAKPDYIDIDGDGDKKEPMKKAAKDKKKK